MRQLRTIRTFVRRQGRSSALQREALDRLWPQYGIAWPQENSVDLKTNFAESDKPLIIEIGFGMGEAFVQSAVKHPQYNFIGIEVHRPGLGSALARIDAEGCQNAKIMEGDALELLAKLKNNSIHAVHLFFPDPWPKQKHHKRRLVQASFVDTLIKVLEPNGFFRTATDWQNYDRHVQAVFTEFADKFISCEPEFNKFSRPTTKFENRGIRLGHGVYDQVLQMTCSY